MTKKGHFSGKRRMPTLPTATKEQKVQKIRNAEYYDLQGVQDAAEHRLNMHVHVSETVSEHQACL